MSDSDKPKQGVCVCVYNAVFFLNLASLLYKNSEHYVHPKKSKKAKRRNKKEEKEKDITCTNCKTRL